MSAHWTPGFVERVKQLAAGTRTVREVAPELGLTENALRRGCSKRKIRWRAADRLEAKERRERERTMRREKRRKGKFMDHGPEAMNRAAQGLRREIAAAKSEMATAPLFRPARWD